MEKVCEYCGEKFVPAKGTNKLTVRFCSPAHGHKKTWGPIVDGDVAQVPLFGRGAPFAIVDSVDLPLIRKHTWRSFSNGRTMYAVAYIGGKRVLMHRLILGTPVGMSTDHIDGDGLNNRRSNLRACTQKENLWNMGSKGNASGYKGVFARGSKWQVKIRVGEKHAICVGTFSDKLIAALAYNIMAYRKHGEFARFNKLVKGEVA